MNSPNKKSSAEIVSRRNFLAIGGVGLVGASLSEAGVTPRSNSRSVINVIMNGGPSQLETFDPKPEAPREVRGPIRSIQTSIPGLFFSESLPQLAKRASDLVVLRSLYHEASPVHETGLQLLLTGSLVQREGLPPNVGCFLNQVLQENKKTQVQHSIRLGGTIQQTGLKAYHGDLPGLLDQSESLSTPASMAETGYQNPDFHQATSKEITAYGHSHMGNLLWQAARYVAAGFKYVEINTFSQLEGQLTWDAHGDQHCGPATVLSYRDKIAPQYDTAMSALIDDLQASGLWDQTLIVSTGEMGRTPRINDNGGRDHWPHAWSGILAGGGLNGGQVIGETDEVAERIVNQPIHLSEIPGLIGAYLLGEQSPQITLSNGNHWSLPTLKTLIS